MIDQYIKFLEQSYDLNFDLVVQSQILETDIIPSDNNSMPYEASAPDVQWCQNPKHTESNNQLYVDIFSHISTTEDTNYWHHQQEMKMVLVF